MDANKWVPWKAIAVVVSAAAAVCLLIFAGVEIYIHVHTVTINDVPYRDSIEQLSLSGSDLSDSFDVLFKFKRPKEMDLSNTGLTPAQYDRLHEAYPDCVIRWSVPLGNQTYSSSVESLTLDESISPSDLQYIRYFPHLQTLDASGYPLCDELYAITVGLDEADRWYGYIVQDTLYGAEITQQTQELDLSDRSIEDLSEFYQKLRFFPNIRQIYVGDCKASDEAMDALNLAFPDTKIVWLVEFGKWQVRTDIKVFSTLVGVIQNKSFTQKQLYPLLHYCTDLMALDLGHNRITDISGFNRLTNLEVLIIANNPITDIGALRNFPKLHYLEIFNCPKLTDLAPLGACTELEEVQITNVRAVKNLSALTNCKKLRRIYGRYVEPTDCTWADIQAALPDCKIEYKGTRSDWRTTDKNQMIRTAFANWEKIVTYNHWDNVVYDGYVRPEPKYNLLS